MCPCELQALIYLLQIKKINFFSLHIQLVSLKVVMISTHQILTLALENLLLLLCNQCHVDKYKIKASSTPETANEFFWRFLSMQHCVNVNDFSAPLRSTHKYRNMYWLMQMKLKWVQWMVSHLCAECFNTRGSEITQKVTLSASAKDKRQTALTNR